MDTFELPPDGEIRINGAPLLDVIREAELPSATAEYDERTANGETGIYNLAGEYLYMPPSMYFLPNRNLLDEPYSLAAIGFAIPENDPQSQKATILQCTCGVPDCWFLMTHITLEQNVVRWSAFEQFHRDWKYNLSFNFDRTDYESQLAAPVA